jgi:hypothetical protein
MFIALSYIGLLPSYIVECVHQIRLYYNDDIYIIISDINSIYINKLLSYNIKLINYDTLYSSIFNEAVNKNINKFTICHALKNREKLFIYSIERFFLLYNLMNKYEITDAIYLELDNLIYDNPYNWLNEFNKNDICYMYDNDNRYSAGLMYVKNTEVLKLFIDFIITYINLPLSKDINEMYILSIFYKYYNNKIKIQLLPIYWMSDKYDRLVYSNFDNYNSLFDAASIGIYLLGLDPYHTNGVIEKGHKNPWSKMDYRNDRFEWFYDIDGNRKPYIWFNDKWLLINNLHVHSKDLSSGLSKPL